MNSIDCISAIVPVVMLILWVMAEYDAHRKRQKDNLRIFFESLDEDENGD